MPPQWEAHEPRAEKARCSNKDPVQPKVKINTVFKINKSFLKISFQLCMAHCNRNLDSAYLTYMQSTSCEMPGWMKHKLESRLLREISITSDVQMTPPNGRKWRGTKQPLDESERGECKSWFKTLKKTKIMVSGTIISWQIDGDTMETVTDFIFLGSKITADGDCNHEIKRHLFLGRKAMTNVDSIIKSRDITFPKKVHLVKAMVFPVVMDGCES